MPIDTKESSSFLKRILFKKKSKRYRLNVARDLRNARLKGLTRPVLGKEVQKLSSRPVHGLNGFG